MSDDTTQLEIFRRNAALAILLEMLGNGGERDNKIHAAVSYANGLIEELLARPATAPTSKSS
jgi:hypothetical protein